MKNGWVVAVVSIGLAGCVTSEAEKISGRAIADDRILPATTAGGSIVGVEAPALEASWTEGHFSGVTLTLPQASLIVISADATPAAPLPNPDGTAPDAAGPEDPTLQPLPLDPVLLVYGPRSAQGSWTARLVKVDASEGTVERTAATRLEAGQYLIAVGEFERRAGHALVKVERALTVQTLEVHGYVFGNDVSGDDAARVTWGAACDAWHQAALARLGEGAAESSFTCGAASDIDAASWIQLASEPVLTIRAELTGPPLALGARTVTGRGQGSTSQALVEWRTACATLEEQMAAVYGPRLLAVSCGKPSDVDVASSWTVYRSTPSIAVAPAATTAVEATDLVYAAEGNGDDAAAVRSLEAACDAWMDEQVARAGAGLVSVECGPAHDDDASTSWSDYSASATARYAAGPGREAVMREMAPLRGTGAGSNRGAGLAWRAACKGRLDALQTELAGNLLGATCGTPRDVDGSTSWVVYESTPIVWMAR